MAKAKKKKAAKKKVAKKKTAPKKTQAKKDDAPPFLNVRISILLDDPVEIGAYYPDASSIVDVIKPETKRLEFVTTVPNEAVKPLVRGIGKETRAHAGFSQRGYGQAVLDTDLDVVIRNIRVVRAGNDESRIEFSADLV